MIDTGSRQSVLIVDDVPANIRILEFVLRSDKYEIRVTTNGAEALELSQGPEPPDLILLDITMPLMDGYEVCRILKENAGTRQIPVIFITSRTEEEEEARGFELGAVDYITKPFSPAIVRARVNTQLALKRYRDHLKDLVSERTAELTKTNKQLQWEIARRKRAQAELKRSHDELEQRVKERTAELSRSNGLLKEEIRKQEISIELAKRLLHYINGDFPRMTNLPDGRILFVEPLLIPCHAEGGDHHFFRTLNRGGKKRTVISLKDQSGHEVGCVLRSILTDLAHKDILTDGGDEEIGETMGRLNTEVCRSNLLGTEDFFTGITAELHHDTLLFRYVSAGHPPLLLIREDTVQSLPMPGEPGSNIPVGIREGFYYTAGECRLQVGDRLIFYTDGLTEMPLSAGKEMINIEGLEQLTRRLVEQWRKDRGCAAPVSALMRGILNAIAREAEQEVTPLGSDGKRHNSSDDDVTLLGLEVESAAETEMMILYPSGAEDLSGAIEKICRRMESRWAKSSGAEPLHHLRTVIGEAVINAWRHGNRRESSKPIQVAWRIGNDLTVTVADMGSGFDIDTIPDPTAAENLTRTSGRGVYIIRQFADKARWQNQGREVEICFYRQSAGSELFGDDDSGFFDEFQEEIFQQKEGIMELSVNRQGESARFSIAGNIDEQGAEELKRKFKEMNTASMKEIVFDFRGVNHIGSAGIGKLLLFYKDLALNDGTLRIENASQTIYELFTVLKLDSIFSISKA